MASENNAAFQMNTTRVGRNNSFGRLLRSGNCFGKHVVIGRYYIAAMLFILNIISTWKLLNFSLSFLYARYNDNHFFSPAFQKWTTEDHQTFKYGISGGQIFVQIPAALLIYLTSSHKFLTAAVAISSVLHMILPIAGNIHPSCLMVILCAHYIVEAPLRIAALSIWKDWAPPGGQTIFVFISFSSLILGQCIALSMNVILTEVVATQGSFYLSGACGLVWSLLWFFTVSDTPENNPQCPQNEQSCLQNATRSAVKNKLKITDVPWKSILMANPVIVLCLIYFKIGGSSFILHQMSVNFSFLLQFDGHISLTSFYIIFAVLYTVILLSSAIATDLLNRKYPRKFNIKKGIFCTVLVIHGILLLGTLYNRIIVQTIILCLSYFIFSISIPGFMINALELSTKYVSIIGGFIETFYRLGDFISHYYMAEMYKFLDERQAVNLEGQRLLYEVAVAIFVAVPFLIWGSMEEQSWSLSTASSHASATAEAHITSEEHDLNERSEVPSNTLEVC